ncbi:MAG: formate transporter FocA, partial [Nitrospiraceae bacterium]
AGLAGAFISLGALFYTVTVTGAGSSDGVSFGLVRFAGGVTLSLGLVLTVVGGAELFMRNNLLAMAWAAGRIHTRQVVRN